MQGGHTRYNYILPVGDKTVVRDGDIVEITYNYMEVDMLRSFYVEPDDVDDETDEDDDLEVPNDPVEV
jgi:hypothetical protein